MNLLAFDTAASPGSVALWRPSEPPLERETAPQTRHSRQLLSLVHQVLAQAGLGLSDITLIAVNTGPGAFTSLRLGLGIAQGIGFSRGLKVVEVGSLAALADTALHHNPAAEHALAVMDARLDQVYWGLYRRAGSGVESVIADQLTRPEEVRAKARDLIACGDAWRRYPGRLPEYPVCADTRLSAAGVARLAAAAADRAIAPEQLRATYLRAAVIPATPG